MKWNVWKWTVCSLRKMLLAMRLQWVFRKKKLNVERKIRIRWQKVSDPEMDGEENLVKISFIVLCNQVLNRHKVENHDKISFIVLCNQVLNCHKVENHDKISFIVLCNQVLNCHKVENLVKISFIVLSNQVLNCHKVENHDKISFKYLDVTLVVRNGDENIFAIGSWKKIANFETQNEVNHCEDFEVLCLMRHQWISVATSCVVALYVQELNMYVCGDF